MSGMKVVETENALVDRLWFVNDHGLNENRLSRIHELRKSIRTTASQGRSKRVVLTRGTIGEARNLVNSDEVYEALEKVGFEILCPEREPVGRIVEVLSSAEIAIVVEGSVQSHCTYAMPVGSTLITIQPPTRFNAVSKDRCDAVGIHWGFVVADPRTDGFFLPIDRLMRTLDEVQRVTGRGALA
jgi:capsular polysaccharide biosynthesis protein